MTVLLLVGGLVVLTVGAELLVRGASALAVAMGISPLVVGLTVVAFGTGSPELVICLQSALSGQPDIALGNVVGSNISNVLLILGLSALIIPLSVAQQLVRFDAPLMVLVSAAVLLMGWDGRLDQVDGVILVGSLIAYTAWGIFQSRREKRKTQEEYADALGETKPATSGRVLRNIAFVVVGLVLLILGARWFTEGAVTIARSFGISELVIGLTIVAIGTSLPELATSIMAAFRGERDIAVGNAVGSNLFNIMGVLGITSLASGEGIAIPDAALRFDIPVMIAVAFACLPIFFTGHLIARWEGAVFVGYFIAYTAYLVVTEITPDLTRTFATVMGGFVIPLTVLTLIVTVVRSIRGGNVTDSPAET